ncbi:hypothetical protein HPB50_027030 [Hyalomma asiaticum]|uniref:Uncharacterized protein n=1 Tax=Hyalomma asiaticum TaxID=266040 RepID=A0ACB7RSY0_HYAAI|nr:hypothetical protein HPB50_027030 [Hyalomma asiaticum]
MADTPEDFPPFFTLSSTMGRSRAYDLLLREAGKILNCPPSRVPLSHSHRGAAHAAPNGTLLLVWPSDHDRATRRRTPFCAISVYGQQPRSLLCSCVAIPACRGSCRGHVEPPCTRADPLFPAIMHGPAGNQRPATRGGKQQLRNRTGGTTFLRCLVLLLGAFHPSPNCPLLAPSHHGQQQSAAC